MTTYDTDAFIQLLSYINAEATRLTGDTVPAYSSQYFLPEEDVSQAGGGCGTPPVRKAKPSKLSALLQSLTQSQGKVAKEVSWDWFVQ